MKNLLSEVAIFVIVLTVLTTIVLIALKAAPKKVVNQVTDRIDCPIYAPCPRGYKNKNRK